MNLHAGERTALTFMLAIAATPLVAFVMWPLAQSVWVAVRFGDGFTGGHFQLVLGDPLFWASLANSAVYAAAFAFTQLPLSLGIALLMSRRELRGAVWMRTAVFSTSVVGGVFVGVIVGSAAPLAWLNHPLLARLLLVLATLWTATGMGMMLCIAALQQISPAILEAARVDGATASQRLRVIILPAVWPALTVIAIIAFLSALQMFELPFVVFNGVGPGGAGLTLVGYLFALAFEQGETAQAAAVCAATSGTLAIGTLAALLARHVALRKRHA